MKSTVVAALMGLGLAACSPTPAPQPSAPIAVAPPVIVPGQRPRPRPTPAPVLPPDMCGARPLQYLVGKPRSEIPVPVTVINRRVTCTTCPVTMDYREDRLNIFFDADTGIIKEVKCG